MAPKGKKKTAAVNTKALNNFGRLLLAFGNGNGGGAGGTGGGGKGGDGKKQNPDGGAANANGIQSGVTGVAKTAPSRILLSSCSKRMTIARNVMDIKATILKDGRSKRTLQRPIIPSQALSTLTL